MKIFFVDNNYHSLVNFRGEVINHVSLWNDVTILYPKSTYIPGYENYFQPAIRRIGFDCLPSGKNILADLKLIMFFFKLYKKEQPDIVFHYTVKPNIYGSIAASLANCKSVSMVAGLGYIFSKKGIIGMFGRFLYRYALKKNARVIVLNKDNYNYFFANHYVDSNKLILFLGGEGVNLRKFRYVEKSFLCVQFIMVARVLYDKGYTEYVEAAKLVKRYYPKIQFYLLGNIDENSPTGVPRSIVEKDSQDGKIFNYIGWVSDVPSIIRQDGMVMVLPSKYGEGLNRSLMEACAMGCPIITTNISGCKELVENNVNGYVVEPGDSFALAQAIIKFIELSNAKKRSMSIESYNFARKLFDVNNVIRQYDKIIETIRLE